LITRLNRLITAYLRPYWKELLAALALQVVATVMSLYLPNLNAQIIDDGVVKGDTDLIWRSGALMLLFSLVQAAGQIGATWFGALTAMSLGRDLRAAIFDRALSFSTREMRDFGASRFRDLGAFASEFEFAESEFSEFASSPCTSRRFSFIELSTFDSSAFDGPDDPVEASSSAGSGTGSG